MKPTDTQQFAIQAKLSMQLGPEVFDTVFVGTEIAAVSNGEMRVLAHSAHCASVIESKYLGMLAVIVESVLKQPIKFATVAAKNVRRCSEP